jgi:hypothetical protein
MTDKGSPIAVLAEDMLQLAEAAHKQNDFEMFERAVTGMRSCAAGVPLRGATALQRSLKHLAVCPNDSLSASMSQYAIEFRMMASQDRFFGQTTDLVADVWNLAQLAATDVERRAYENTAEMLQNALSLDTQRSVIPTSSRRGQSRPATRRRRPDGTLHRMHTNKRLKLNACGAPTKVLDAFIRCTLA